jgi:hypothetical protein
MGAKAKRKPKRRITAVGWSLLDGLLGFVVGSAVAALALLFFLGIGLSRTDLGILRIPLHVTLYACMAAPVYTPPACALIASGWSRHWNGFLAVLIMMPFSITCGLLAIALS